MEFVIAHAPTNREFVSNSKELEFEANTNKFGVVSSRYAPKGGAEIRHMYAERESVRAAYRAMVNESGSGFKPEFQMDSTGWYASQVGS